MSPLPNTQRLLTLIYPEVFINGLSVRHFHTEEGHLFWISNSLQGQTSSHEFSPRCRHPHFPDEETGWDRGKDGVAVTQPVSGRAGV